MTTLKVKIYRDKKLATEHLGQLKLGKLDLENPSLPQAEYELAILYYMENINLVMNLIVCEILPSCHVFV